MPIPGATVLDAVLDALPLSQGAARGHLARFLFRGDDVFKEVAALSGGERSRLELALLFLLPANLLLLDEPTNHLDIPAREALESFMASTDATLLVVSHDRRLLEKVCDSLWVVDGGLAVPFEGGYRAWRAAVADGWTVKAAAESEARRLHGGRSAPVGARPGGAVGSPARKSEARSGGGAAASDRPVAAAGASGRVRVAKLSKDAYHVARSSSTRSWQADRAQGRLSRPWPIRASTATSSSCAASAASWPAWIRPWPQVEQAWLEMEEAAP